MPLSALGPLAERVLACKPVPFPRRAACSLNFLLRPCRAFVLPQVI